MRKINTLLFAVLFAAVLLGCDKGRTEETPSGEKTNHFHIAFASGTGSNSATLVQGTPSLMDGEISPKKGYELESSRTARIFSSADGKFLWSLNYTVGTIEKLEYVDGDKYNLIKRVDASILLGTKALRFTKLNENYASVHYISATADFEDNSVPSSYKGHKMLISLGILNLSTMEIENANKNIPLSIDADLAKQGYYIYRIDSPVLSGNKLYYGVGLRKYNFKTGKNDIVDKTSTLIVDYPSLTSPKVIFTDHVCGTTNGYRTPTQYVNEQGEILQLVSGNESVNIAKISNGEYVKSYNFNLSNLLNKKMNSNGYFYVGNGIAYIPYEDLSKEKIQIGVNPSGEPTYSSMWKLAKVNLNTNSAIDLIIPDNLWLTQYQNSVSKNNKFYIALSPVGKDGNVYIFDNNSLSPNGTIGAKITGTGAEQYYIGIY